MLRQRRLLKLFGSAALLCAALLFLCAIPAVHAQVNQINPGLTQVARGTGLGTQDIRVIIARVIQVALSLLGIILVVLIIYGGFLYMTAGGNEEQITKAKGYLRNAVIGLVIILASVAIAQFVISQLIGATTGGGGGPGFEQQVTGRFGDYGSGALGEGIVQSHYPPPGATDVARNTRIIVTFKRPMDPASIIANGKIVAANIRIIKTADISGTIPQTAAGKFITDVDANATVDNKTFVFKPTQFLGSPTERVSYTVKLESGLKLADGTAAFGGAFGDGYKWEFETGTVVDITPPKVVSVYPRDGMSGLPRNTLIQVNFDDAVDPVTSSGDAPPFSNLTVVQNVGGTPTAVPGAWTIGNQYRTVEFRSNVKSGTNSCGADVYVLPANASIGVAVSAANAKTAPPQADLPYPFDGVTDVAGNALDGDGDGKAEGPTFDSVPFAFSTSGTLDTTGPQISAVAPTFDQSGADLTAPVAITMDEPLSATSISNSTISFGVKPNISLWYYATAVNLAATGEPAKAGETVVRTRAEIDHATLAPSVGLCLLGIRAGKDCSVDTDCPGGSCSVTRFDYYPNVTSGVTDMAQNCFYPACGTDPGKPFCCSGTACSTACAIASGGAVTCP